MRLFAIPRRRLAVAVAVIVSAVAAVAASVALPQAYAEEPDAALPTWSDQADGFAALEGMGRGPTTGGAGGETVTVTTFDELNQYVQADEPYVIRVSDQIDVEPRGYEMRVASNKTIIGVGTSGEIVGGGFFLGEGVHNVIIRNLTIRDTLMPEDDPGDDDFDYDAIQLDTADHIWIDHNRLARMNDGLLDSRKDTTFLTVSWNQFLENNKTFGIGWTDNVTSQITIHHNWFRDTNSRNPSADNIANLHMYNNYLQDTGSGNFARGLTQAVIENSYYDGVKNPYYTEEGELVQRGNIDVNSDWGDVIREQGNAFDPSDFYDYELDPASEIPELVTTGSGPQPDIGGVQGEPTDDPELPGQPSSTDPIGYASMNGGTTGGFGADSVTEIVLSEYWAGSGHGSPGEAMYELLYEHKGAPASEGLVIHVDETITPDQLSHEDMRLEKVQNVSILGVSDAGEFDGVGINLIEADNIIVRNLTIHHNAQGTGDGISVQRNSNNVWIDHNEIYNEFQGVDKDYYDALIDVRKGSEYVTVSWNHLHDSWKTGLTASSDSEGEASDNITYAHNWFENVNSRVPLIRRSHVHMLNNYFLDVADTAVNCRMGAQVLVEGNYFENVGDGEIDPETGDVQGPVGWFYGSPEPGYWNLVDNAYAGTTPYEHLESTTDWTVPYDYEALSPEEAKAQAMQNAGVGIIDTTS